MSLGGILGISPNEVSSTPTATLLDRGTTKQGTFVYAQAGEALARYAACKISSAGQATEFDTTESAAVPSMVGFPQVALANDEYGWFWVGEGGATAAAAPEKVVYGLVADSVTAGAKMTTTATEGVIGAGGDVIQGLTTLTTTGAAGAPHTVALHNPGVCMTNAQD